MYFLFARQVCAMKKNNKPHVTCKKRLKLTLQYLIVIYNGQNLISSCSKVYTHRSRNLRAYETVLIPY